MNRKWRRYKFAGNRGDTNWNLVAGVAAVAGVKVLASVAGPRHLPVVAKKRTGNGGERESPEIEEKQTGT